VEYRTLSPEQEREYLRRLRSGDLTARDPLIESRMSQALDLARRAAGPNLPIEDACTVAKLAVIRAVDKGDPDKGDFASYVGTCVRYALVRQLKANLAASAKDQDQELRARFHAKSQERGTRRRAGLDSGDQPFSTSGPATVSAPEPEPVLARMRQQVLTLLPLLPRQERSAVEHHLAGKTLASWAQAQGLTTARASQILASARKRLTGLVTQQLPIPATPREAPKDIVVKVDIETVLARQRGRALFLAPSAPAPAPRPPRARTFRRTGYPSDRGTTT
jgi:RNA polymerase sigma factor (sigma-70 family)